MVRVVQRAGSVPLALLCLGPLQEFIPVKLVVRLINLVFPCSFSEEAAQVVVVGCVLEAQVPDVKQIRLELSGETLAQVLDGGGLLLLPDLLVFLLVSRSLQTLPWKAPSKEVHEHMAEGFEVVTPRLFSSKMGVDTHIPCRAR